MFSPIELLLRNHKLRQKAVHLLQNKFFNELNISIPIENGYWANLHEKDAYDSFSEIFIKREYKDFLPPHPPEKIIDLGAHYGFFSLWLQSIYPETDIRALLVEPSQKCHPSLEHLLQCDKLEGRFRLLRSCIGNPSDDSAPFFERPFMASSVINDSKEDNGQKTKVLKIHELLGMMHPPYDIVKCDVEGSEWELISHYGDLLKKTKFLILEWHSWHNGGGSKDQIIESLKHMHFSIVNSSVPSPATGRKGQVGLILAANESIAN